MMFEQFKNTYNFYIDLPVDNLFDAYHTLKINVYSNI